MTHVQEKILFLLRVFLGWVLFYAGITKVLDADWSASGYLENATSLSGVFEWFASPGVLPFTNFLNEWGLTLLGVALILGLFTHLSAYLAAVLMLLYYFPVLDFPFAGEHSYIIDDHVIYAVAFLLLGAFQTGRVMGLDANVIKRLPKRCRWLG